MLLGNIKKEIKDLLKNKYIVEFDAVEFGNWDMPAIEIKLKDLLSRGDIDIILAEGVMTSQAILKKKELPIPVFIIDLIAHDILNMPHKDGSSGFKNLLYLTREYAYKKDIECFREVADFNEISILIDEAYLPYAQEEAKASLGQNAGSPKTEFIMYGSNARETLSRIAQQKPEALYITPARFSIDEQEKLIDGINDLKIPSFSFSGYMDVKRGVLVGLVPKLLTKFTRRIAINVEKIFMGDKPEDIPVLFQIQDKFVVNVLTAHKIGISLPFSVLLNAELIDTDVTYGKSLSIYEAVANARKNNIIFRVKDEEIKEARKNYHIAWSSYLPAITTELNYNIYDSGRARIAPPSYPKWGLTGTAVLNQLIFSHPVVGQILNSAKQVRVEKLNRRSQDLDTTYDSYTTYVQYLQRKALLKIQKDNLDTNRKHLRMAKRRKEIGVGAPEETFRWQSEVSQSMSDIIQADAALNVARITLNQLMNVSQEKEFAEEDVGLETIKYYIANSDLDHFIKNRQRLLLFLELMTEDAIANSPELKTLDLGIKQQKQNVNVAAGKFLLPEVQFEAQADNNINSKYYAARTPLQKKLDTDYTDWTLGISLSYPLYEGGERIYKLEQEKAELRRLKFTRELKVQQTELDVRKAVYNIGYSFSNIEFSHSSMSDAVKNFEIVQKKYFNGTASITDMVDAQNERYGRESDAMIAIYNFLHDLAYFDRAISHFYSLDNEEDQKEWLESLKERLKAHGVVL